MSTGETLAVEALIDRQRFGRFGLRVLVLLFVATFTDGYDLQAAAQAAPSLIREWGIPAASLTPVLTATLFGVLVGAPFFGWVGDRFGRKRATVLGCAVCGLFTLFCAWAQSLEALVALRFLAGAGIGGVLPNAIALSAELSPRRIRARLTILMFIGLTAGGGAPALIVRFLVPSQGWPVIFLIGGVAPLAIALLLLAALPESLTFLAGRGRDPAALLRLARQIEPGLPAGTRLAARPRPAAEAAEGAHLFAGGFALVTPLLWVAFASVLLTIYLLTSWLPVVLTRSGMAPGEAALMTSGFQLGGSLGGLAVSLLLDRFGWRLVTALFVLSGAGVALIAGLELSDRGLALAMGAAGFCILGLQFGLNASAGLIYPIALRAKGVGLALAIGRFGSIAGPGIGGLLIALGLASTRHLFLVPVVPLALGGIASVALSRLTAAGPR